MPGRHSILLRFRLVIEPRILWETVPKFFKRSQKKLNEEHFSRKQKPEQQRRLCLVTNERAPPANGELRLLLIGLAQGFGAMFIGSLIQKPNLGPHRLAPTRSPILRVPSALVSFSSPESHYNPGSHHYTYTQDLPSGIAGDRFPVPTVTIIV